MIWCLKEDSIDNIVYLFDNIKEQNLQWRNFAVFDFSNVSKTPMVFYVIVPGKIANMRVMSAEETKFVDNKLKNAEDLNYYMEKGILTKKCKLLSKDYLEVPQSTIDIKLYKEPSESMFDFSQQIPYSEQTKTQISNVPRDYEIARVVFTEELLDGRLGFVWEFERKPLVPYYLNTEIMGTASFNMSIFIETTRLYEYLQKELPNLFRTIYQRTPYQLIDYIDLKSMVPKEDYVPIQRMIETIQQTVASLSFDATNLIMLKQYYNDTIVIKDSKITDYCILRFAGVPLATLMLYI
ncbi:hypothetical protein [Carp edema virus]|nr:hypothetical protein [Carp edema virus]